MPHGPTLHDPGTAAPLELGALLGSAGMGTAINSAWLRVTGEDRVRWLNGMVTNSIQGLRPGEGNYSFLLNAQGRIQAEMYAFLEPEAILIETAAAELDRITALLDRFIIMDDVDLARPAGFEAGLLLAGEAAPSLLASLGLPVGEPVSLRRTPWGGREVLVIAAHSPLVPRFELWSDPGTAAALGQQLQAEGAVSWSPELFELLRVLEGTPRFGVDLRDRDLPQETAQTRALHFSKGCYLGQEIVERIRSRGSVHRTFTGFRLSGEPVTPGPTATLSEAAIPLMEEPGGKPVGELTSVAALPTSAAGERPVQIALGYVRREALDRQATLRYPGGIAEPVALPFPLPAPSARPGASEG